MHEYFFRPEVVRVALVVGVVVSILFYERVQLTTGGAIVPAYLAMFLPAPLYIGTTIAAGYLTYVIVNRVIGTRRILYGRRKFEVEMLVGLGLVAVGTTVAILLRGASPLLAGLSGIGFLVPGVLAHDMFRQKPRKTILAVLATTGIVAAIMFVFASLLEISPLGGAFELAPFDQRFGYPIQLLLVGVAASVLVGMLVFSRLGLRSGGFVSGAYLALVLVRPLDLLFSAVIALLTYTVVVHVVMPNLLIFGRRKLSAMVLVGAVLAWTGEVVVSSATSGAFVPWSGFTLMTLMIPALLANDMQRQGIERTAWGVGITTITVFGVVNLLAAALSALGLLDAWAGAVALA